MTLGWQEFLANHPLAGEAERADFWDGFLTQHPDVLHRLLADVYQAAHGTERPPTLDDLWQLVATPTFSSAPFPEALYAALGKRSMRWLAKEMDIHLRTIQRWVSGERPIVYLHDPEGSMRRLEDIARALRVHPSYFAEWRRLWIMHLIDHAFTEQPDLSVGFYRRFTAVRSRLNGR